MLRLFIYLVQAIFTCLGIFILASAFDSNLENSVTDTIALGFFGIIFLAVAFVIYAWNRLPDEL